MEGLVTIREVRVIGRHFGVSEDLSVRNPGIPHFPQRDLWGIRGDFTSPVSALTRH